MSLTAPQAFGQTGNDVAKNTNKPKVENAIPVVKKDTLTMNETPQWRKDLDSANLNKINFMTANFEKYKEYANKLSVDQMKALLVRQQDIDRYQTTI